MPSSLFSSKQRPNKSGYSYMIGATLRALHQIEPQFISSLCNAQFQIDYLLGSIADSRLVAGINVPLLPSRIAC